MNLVRIGCDSIVTAVAIWLLSNANPGFTIWKYGLFGRTMCVLAVLTAIGVVVLIDWLARDEPVMTIFLVASILIGVATEHFDMNLLLQKSLVVSWNTADHLGAGVIMVASGIVTLAIWVLFFRAHSKE